MVGIDIEMFGMSKPHLADGTFASMSVHCLDQPEKTYLVLEESDIQSALERVDKGIWCMQNALFDLRVLRRFAQLDKTRDIHDTMVVEQDLFGGWYSRFGLANLARRWLERRVDKGPRKLFEQATQMTPEMEVYAVDDAVVVAQIASKQLEYIWNEYDGIMPWYWDIDGPLIDAILNIKPVRIDVDAWRKHNQRVLEDVERLQGDLGFNVLSHKIVKEKIQQALGRNIRNTNANDTLKPLLTKLNEAHPAHELITQILHVRSLRKAAETYGESWVDRHVNADGYVVSSPKITGTETGRMAWADPNLQNIPVREWDIYRTFFIASPGHVLQVADVSLQENWFMAFLSQDPVMLQELHSGQDLHQIYADMFNVSRDKGKNVHHGLNYGMSEYGLSRYVGISVEEARAGIQKRNKRYRVAAAQRKQWKSEARRSYKVHTVTGRPVWINPYNEQWERNAINAPVQGSAADHTKLATLKLFQKCEAEGLPYRAILVVHDELVQDVPIEQKDIYGRLLQESWDEASAELAPGMAIKTKVLEGKDWSVK